MSIQAVILDCDGTLVDSERTCSQALADYATELGYRLSYEQTVARYTGVKLNRVFDQIATSLGRALPADHLEVFRSKQLDALRQGVRPIPGADALLRGLRLPYCVASNAPQVKMRLCLESAGLLPYFDDSTLLSAYDVQAWKPDPTLLLAAASRLGTSPANCALVEDSLPGIEGGIAAGMQVFALDRHNQLPKLASCVRSFSSLDEIRMVLEAVS